MKRILLLFSIFHLVLSGFATTYYSQGSLNPALLTSWNTVRTGGGATPASLTLPGDVFVIQSGHSMVTSTNISIGAAGSTLRVEENGTLVGANAINLSGVFEIQDGGTYIHNNTSIGIFNGTENFAAASTVQIEQWVSNDAGLPTQVQWGNLIIARNIGANLSWQLSGSLTVVRGNFEINSTGEGSVVLTENENQLLTIDGDLIVNAGTLIVKSGSDAGTFSNIQVNDDISINGGILDLGLVDFIGNNYLRFKGDLTIMSGGELISSSQFAFVDANGTERQFITAENPVSASIRISQGSMVDLGSPLIFLEGMYFVVAGTLNAGMNIISLPEGQLFVPGGTLNTSVGVDLINGNCTVCTGDGENVFVDWCKATGSRGALNATQGTLLFSQSPASNLYIGYESSPGDVSIVNGTISFTEEGRPTGRGSVVLSANSSLFLDATSFIEGRAFYNANGGKLIIGSVDGITVNEEFGAIIVDGARNYNASGRNSFEYRGEEDQVTGNGLPSTFSGDLIINNLADRNVLLTDPVTIQSGGKLQLQNGNLVTIGSDVLTLAGGATTQGGSKRSFVDGRLIRKGNGTLVFPVGKNGIYSPVTLNGNAGQATDEHSAEYFPGNPRSTYDGTLIDLQVLSAIEYWRIERINGEGARLLTLPFGAHSGVTDPSTIVAAYFDGNSFWHNYKQTAGYTGTAQGGTITTSTAAFGIFSLGSTSAENTLPLRLLTFDAKKQGMDRLINWEISLGDNPVYFEVLASVDNRNFVKLGTVNASLPQLKYNFVDRNSLDETTYYRLRVVGVDGKVYHSRIVVVFAGTNNQNLITLYPTITRGSATLSVTSPDSKRLQVTVSGVQGTIIQHHFMQLKAGENRLNIDLSSLSPGTYLVTTIDERNKRQTLKLIKQ